MLWNTPAAFMRQIGKTTYFVSSAPGGAAFGPLERKVEKLIQRDLQAAPDPVPPPHNQDGLPPAGKEPQDATDG